jgi:hypothetical protein
MGTRHFGAGLESAWNTPVAPTVYAEALSETLELQNEMLEIKTIRTISTRKVERAFGVVRGDITCVGNFQELGWLLWMLTGDVDTTGAGPYVHTYPGSTGFETRNSFTLELQRDSAALTWRYAGCVLTKLGLTVSPDEEMRVAAGFVGASEGTGAAGSSSYETLDVILPKHVAVKFDSTTLDATSCNIDIDWPVDEPKVLGSVTLGKQPQDSDTLTISGTVDVIFEDLVEYAKIATDADIDVEIDVTTSGDEDLSIHLNKCRLSAGTPHLDGRNRLVATYAFMSYFDTTATENIQAVLTNDVASGEIA